MTNYYLDRLEVQPGASAAEIKAAYRKLAKQFHPDVNKSPEAERRFIEIHEAYKFLTEVGPAPNNESISYNFDPREQAYDAWREKAKAYAQEKAREAKKEQKRLLKQLYTYFNYAAIVIMLLNLLLLIDYYLPEHRTQKKVIAVYKVIEKSRSNQVIYKYDDVQFDGFRMRVKKEQYLELGEVSGAEIVSTPLLKTLKQADFQLKNEILSINPAYYIYTIFTYLIPLMLIANMAYFTMYSDNQNKITLAITIIFGSAIQLYIFIQFAMVNQGLG
ncbi:hypothetical protein FNH22_17470 [Fulvivirga sp. M361]|uniref:DnaJ domain-containing protein n=1 Tax=Fulvivirga sp. M361 TaxID=2594266 RepID=UPI001179E0A3|nr:J domain-containing protein [Fulvivirga sp. M361]TRX55954.1 hypothetical protein FNH22_17470 [Fulvivirga sp. M361]